MGKLDPKSRQCIFLGDGYRLWNLTDKKVIKSRDIVFMEDKTIVYREKEKTGEPSWLVGSLLPTKEQGEPTGFKKGVSLVED